MWLTKKQRTASAAHESAELGVATIGGDPAAVYLGTERRSLPVYSPGGYCWKPRTGDALLVLKTGDRHGVAGTVQETDNQLLPGEVAISSSGGAALKLNNEGEIELEGELLINGETLESLVTRLAGGVLPSS